MDYIVSNNLIWGVPEFELFTGLPLKRVIARMNITHELIEREVLNH